jgi:hypothetical protein
LEGQFELSEDYQHLASEPAEFDKVIKQRMAKLVRPGGILYTTPMRMQLLC